MTLKPDANAYVEGDLDTEWLTTWNWADANSKAAQKGAEILWYQIVSDVKEFGKPFISTTDGAPSIAVTILGELDHHLIIPLAAIDTELMTPDERLPVAGALCALAFKIASKQ